MHTVDLSELTPRQRQIYEYIRSKIVERGLPPTIREIADQAGIKSPNGVMCHLVALEKKGFIRREPNLARAILLTDEVGTNSGSMQAGSSTAKESLDSEGSLMASEVTLQQLHDRATRGERLTFGERSQLTDWYAKSDAAEAEELKGRGKSVENEYLRRDVINAQEQMSSVSQRIQSITAANDQLRREIADLQRQLATRRSVQPA